MHNFLERVKLRWLLLAVVVFTFLFAGIYYTLDKTGGNGLSRPGGKALVWYDYVYFSVVTETTLGYGDIAPVDSSRAVACIQVIMGLFAAGIIVAKMTSSAINRFSDIQRATRGYWVDMLTMPDGKVWMGIVEFTVREGTIFFEGRNFNAKGGLKHTFRCRLLYHMWPDSLTFIYDDNHAASKLTHGQTIVSFTKEIGRPPQVFQVTISDKSFEEPITAFGWRVTNKKWRRQLARNETSPAFVQELFAHYKTLFDATQADDRQFARRIEIERKFRVTAVPDTVPLPLPSIIEQGYVCVEPDGKEVRLRRRDEKRILTIKGSGDEVRDECEIPLDVDSFNDLWEFTSGRRVIKKRYCIVDGKHLIELDVYDGALSGLIVVEVEFATSAEAASYLIPNWFAEEVTKDPRFKNRRLSESTAPPEPQTREKNAPS